MNKWRRHIATGSVVMALGVASMVPNLALAGNNSYGNQDNGTTNQHMNKSSGSSSSGSMGSGANMNSGGNMGSSGNMNSGGNMGSSGNMNSGGSMGSSGSMSSNQGMGRHMSKSEVMQVQKALNRSGYKLSVDGVMGPHTKSALKKYQQSHGLQATGEPTPQTMQKLGVSR